MNKLKNYLKLMRIKHYLKNVLVLLPMFFSKNIFNGDLIFTAIAGFISFCFTSSIVYIINDLKDIENDKKHPIKKNRPLASGVVSKKESVVLIIILVLIILLINILVLNKNYSWILLIVYLFINILYTYWLKNLPIIDVFILSLGFLLRVMYGGLLLNIKISHWLFLTILSGTLFMAFGKRRNELKKNKNSSRKVLEFYNIDFLDKCMYMFLTITITFYSLWTTDIGKNLLYSIPILILICLEYVFTIEKEDSHGDPVDVILGDKVIIGLLFIFLIYMLISLYILPGGFKL